MRTASKHLLHPPGHRILCSSEIGISFRRFDFWTRHWDHTVGNDSCIAARHAMMGMGNGDRDVKAERSVRWCARQCSVRCSVRCRWDGSGKTIDGYNVAYAALRSKGEAEMDVDDAAQALGEGGGGQCYRQSDQSCQFHQKEPTSKTRQPSHS
jgi:hypothetical protein